ncbi:MAG: DUF3499 domain-containing protein [Actinomycetota bacterium]|nr:DUF3499 domain-containing protein [Actinomycetota bacterium]MDQ4125023.1 DUF3499 domain-containing protein [Actinomycetota bacterium]
MNPCSKPGCANPGAALLGYDYAERRAVLDDPPDGEVSPHSYVLCTRCAEKLTPPRGWVLDDNRAEPPLFLDRVAKEREAPAAVEALPPPEEPRRQQLFFGYSA